MVGLVIAAAMYFAVIGQAGWSALWVFGLVFGILLQRGRFCFASAFRDLFLFKDGRVMKAVLIGMAVATPGFALAMYNLSPAIVDGRYPANANILPLGWHTIVAGVMFGFGMVVAGGCLTGNLYRVGEGYVTSAVALMGVLIGALLLGWTWSFWWDVSISSAPRIWFPHFAGWAGGIAITLAFIAIAYMLVVWWESRDKGSPRTYHEPAPAAANTFGQRVGGIFDGVFVRAWPVALAGIGLGLFNAFMYSFSHPMGVTGGLYDWMKSVATPIHVAPGELEGLSSIGGACTVGEVTPKFLGLTSPGLINLGVILGAFIAASMAGEFKLRFARQPKRYLQALLGGVLMGYAASLALGCTFGAFFSAVPSLALNAWVFGIGLLAGAFFGVKVIKRIS